MRIRTGIRRTTTQMLNHSRRKTNLSSSRRNSLLSALGNQNSRLASSRLNPSNISSIQTTRLQKSNYEKLERSATSLMEQTKLLAEKADAGGKDLSSTAAQMVSDFNNTLDYLRGASGILNDYYRQSMKEIAATNKSGLAEVGITVRADGTLSLDKDKLASADAEKVKSVLGASGDFAKRMDTIASRTADNAKASAASVASQYTSSGALSSSYLSRYNFRG